MTEAPLTVWVTKYALTDGVVEGRTTEIHGEFAYVRCLAADKQGYFLAG